MSAAAVASMISRRRQEQSILNERNAQAASSRRSASSTQRNLRLRHMRLDLDLGGDPELAQEALREYPDLVEDLFEQAAQQEQQHEDAAAAAAAAAASSTNEEAPTAAASASYPAAPATPSPVGSPAQPHYRDRDDHHHYEPVPTIHSQPLFASSVCVDSSTPRSSAAFDSLALAYPSSSSGGGGGGGGGGGVFGGDDGAAAATGIPGVSTANVVTPVQAVPYQPGAQFVPYSLDARINPAVSTTVQERRVDEQVKRVANLRSKVSAFALVDTFLVMMSPFYGNYPFFISLVLLLCPVYGYYGARALHQKRIFIYLVFSVTMLAMRIVSIIHTLTKMDDRPEYRTWMAVMYFCFLLYALLVTKEVGALYRQTYDMDRSAALRMLVQINLHSHGLGGFHSSGAAIAPEAEVTWSRQSSHHHRHDYDDDELGLGGGGGQQREESISLREALAESTVPARPLLEQQQRTQTTTAAVAFPAPAPAAGPFAPDAADAAAAAVHHAAPAHAPAAPEYYAPGQPIDV